MSIDSSMSIPPGDAIDFSNNGPMFGTQISSNGSSFTLYDPGYYYVSFNVPVSEAGQLCVSLNDIVQEYTMVGRDTSTSQLIGTFIILTTEIGTTLKIINPSNNPTTLTITPSAGGSNPVSVHLVITLLQKI